MVKKKRVYTGTIFKQLVLFTVVTSILPIAVISTVLFRKIETMAEREIIESYNQLALQYTRTIQDKMKQYENSVMVLSQNTTIMEQLENSQKGVYRRGSIISGEIYKSMLLEEKVEIRNCMVYSGETEENVYGSSASTMAAAQKEGWYQYYNEKPGEWFFYQEIQKPSNSIASLVHEIEKVDVTSFRQKKLGIVKLDIHLSRLFAPADTDAKSRNFDVLVYDDDGKVWYSSNKEKKAVPDYLMKKHREGTLKEGTISKLKEQVVSYSKIGHTKLNVLILFGNRGLAEKRKEVIQMFFPIIILLIGCVMVGSYAFTRKFTSRVTILVDKFKMAETGNLSITEPIKGRDEITLLDLQFSHMLEKLDALIQKNYVQEVARKETELKNLQLQINPHFLYNTLETISSIAAVKQIFVVCDICQKLGEIFRYSLGKNYGEFVTVEQELHHVQNYIFIQKLRYENKFEVFYNIEKGLENCMILRFILQPIVENAILHGIDPMTGNGTLEISVTKRDHMLVVKIEDDGVGMHQGEKEALEVYMNRPEQKKDEKKSIGIRNVNQRIKLSCGEEYGIEIETSPYQGCCFSITFPLEKKGAEKDV